ncbi:MAG: DUF3788 domain-containing protein [Oscillospiraceae bacterium]|nr:DUF3788 domain-containing protein [Oscillospiraceae bacterium]
MPPGKGFGEWVYEYKYRRGGKTLCTFYAKQGTAVILIILGKTSGRNSGRSVKAFRKISLLCMMKQCLITTASGCGYLLMLSPHFFQKNTCIFRRHTV